METKTSLIMLQLNTACNFDCEYCYIPTAVRQQNNLISLETVAKLGERLFASNHCADKVQIMFHAGEPLTTPIEYFEQIVQVLLEKKDALNPTITLEFTLMTNGSLITQAWVDLFKKYQVSAGISLDGPAFIHDAKRKTMGKKDSFAQVMRGIKLFQENQLRVGVLSVIHEESLDYPEALVDFYAQHNIQGVGLLTEEFYGQNTGSSLFVNDNHTRLKTFIKRFWEHVQQQPDTTVRFREFFLSFMGLLDKNKAYPQILQPLGFLMIDYMGNFTTFDPSFLHTKNTIYGEDLFFGNIYTHDFIEMLDSPKFQHVYEDLQAGYQRCQATCEYFNACTDIFSGNKISEHGTLNATETNACINRIKLFADVLVESLEQTVQSQTLTSV
jgi:uncharacterized protein